MPDIFDEIETPTATEVAGDVFDEVSAIPTGQPLTAPLPMDPYQRARMEGQIPARMGSLVPDAPEDLLALPEVLQLPIAIGGKALAAGMEATRQLVSPTAWLPPELRPVPLGRTPEEEAERQAITAEKPLYVPRGTVMQPEGNELQRLASRWSSPSALVTLPAGLNPTAALAMAPGMVTGMADLAMETVKGEGTEEQKRDRIADLMSQALLLGKGFTRGRTFPRMTTALKPGRVSEPIPPAVEPIPAAPKPVEPVPVPVPTSRPSIEEKPWSGRIRFETFDEPTGEWTPWDRGIVVSRSTIPGNKPWRATVFAGPKEDPVPIGDVQLDSPQLTAASILQLRDQLGRYTRNVVVDAAEAPKAVASEVTPAEPTPIASKPEEAAPTPEPAPVAPEPAPSTLPVVGASEQQLLLDVPKTPKDRMAQIGQLRRIDEELQNRIDTSEMDPDMLIDRKEKIQDVLIDRQKKVQAKLNQLEKESIAEQGTPAIPQPAPAPAAEAIPERAQIKEDVKKFQDYAAAMVQSASSYIRRSIDSGKTAKDAGLEWAREIGLGLQDTPDSIYKKERGGLYTTTYIKGILTSREGVVLNAKEYLRAVDAGRQEGIAWKQRVLERQREESRQQPPPAAEPPLGPGAQTVGEPGKSQIEGAVSLGSSPLLAVTGQQPGLPPKAIAQIIRDLAKGLGVPIRFGRLRTTKFSGYFQKIQNLIGSKAANDMPIVSHEVGHKLDAAFNLRSNPSVTSELLALGDPSAPGSMSSWTPSKSIAYRRGEGVAEFVRFWITDPAQAARLAPNTLAAFERALQTNVDFEAIMRQAQQDVQRWRTADPQARLHSHISIGDNPNKAHYTLSNLTRDLVNDLAFVRLAVDDAKASTPLLPSQNPYQLARVLRGAYGMAARFIQHEIANFKDKTIQRGTSLEDALKLVSGRVNDFTDWIVAKRAQELRTQGKETGLVSSDVDSTAARFDADPAFNEAFTRIKEWQDGLLQYAVDAGLIEPGDPASTKPTGAAGMRKLHRDYVPFHRLFEIGAGEAPSQEASGTGRGLNVGKPASLRRQTGSPRPIVNPLETMVKNAYTFITAAEKNAISVALADLASRPNMGKWVERVAVPKEAVRVELERIRKQLESAGADLTNVPDDLLMMFYKPSGRAPFGENIIKVNRGGKMEFYRLNKDLFDTFHSLDAESAGKLIQIMAAPAQLLRAGVTTTPDFALANALRDTVSAGVISRYGFTPFVSTIRGIGHLLKNDRLVDEWAASGGRQAVEASFFDRTKLQRYLTEKITKDLTPAERALVVMRNPLAALRYMTGLLEEGTRLGEFEAAYNALRKRGMDPGEARRQAAYESRDLQDFAKGGSHTKVLRMVAPFWNAFLQGNVRLAQAFKERPMQTTLKGLAFITIPKMIEQAINWNDPDYWDKPQWQRDYFFMLPIGKDENQHTEFLRIPVPFQVGVMFATIPGRFMQWGKQNSKTAFDGIVPLMLRETVPVPTSFPLLPLVEAAAGKQGYSYWRGRPIVPESLKNAPPELQVTEQTSLTARKIGKLLGLSPVKVDYLLGAYTGGLGRQLIHQGIDRGISATTGEKRPSLSVVPFGRFMSTPAGSQSQTIDRFYQLLNEAEAQEYRRKAGQRVESRLDVKGLRETADRISGVRRRAMKETDPVSRQQYQLHMVSLAKPWVDRADQQKE